jgi:hypothetical protein
MVELRVETTMPTRSFSARDVGFEFQSSAHAAQRLVRHRAATKNCSTRIARDEANRRRGKKICSF